ncbi:Syntaxin/t-SNARE family protein [Striga hermonthica]|uniref:Syntaxin/t-SNARE family protein n=1 Tax=Striga hermonthica TaxID=68872 RepID=A0A9N7NZG1_STRHE|nr:Syntaxin/t-SNARE family protein [Striga hermonthica]
MLVANSFDLWQKDTFFSAAEEVQLSADIMESAYRTWLRARRESSMSQQLDELSRELQMALGTTKWQLEEFEKAVRLSYRNNSDDITITRHKQFVSAIEGQISRVETSLKESLDMKGKKPFRWVNLDEQECDDLALFLSGTSRRIKNEGINMDPVETSSFSTEGDCSFGCEVNPRSHSLASNVDLNCELQKVHSHVTANETGYEVDQAVRVSPDRTALEIVIDSDDRDKKALIEVTPKEKGFKPFFWRPRGEIYSMMNWIEQHVGGGHRSHRQQQISPVLPLNSIRFILALMLTIFLVVPFLVYST